MQQPGDGHLGRSTALLGGHGEERIEDGGFPGALLGVHQHAQLGGAGVVGTGAVLAGEEATAQGRPLGNGQAQGLGHGQQLAVSGALGQAVFQLDTH
ncbi:hypothetical protein FQZ97_903650 [compost metagenome]